MLKKLGLTEAEASCYEYLFKDGHDTAGNIAQSLGLSRSNVYRALETLESQGFIAKQKFPGWATSYRALPLEQALQNLAVKQRHAVARIVEEQHEMLIRRHI